MGVPHTWYGRYGAWLAKVLQGNFGNSIRTGLPVLPELARVGVNTLVLTLGSLLLTLVIAVPIAVHAAVNGDTAGNTAATVAAYVLSAVPVFWFGYIVVYVFIHWFGMFPLISGAAAKQPHAWLYFLVPIFVLGTASGTLAELIRHLREELSRVLAEDYIRTARAKGAPVWRHAFKEGFLIPVTEIMSAKIPFLLGARSSSSRCSTGRAWAHGVAGGAGPRLPGDHGHRARRRRVRAHGQPAAARGLYHGQPARVQGVIGSNACAATSRPQVP